MAPSDSTTRPIFPTYLLPTLSFPLPSPLTFRRRQSSSFSSNTILSSVGSPTSIFSSPSLSSSPGSADSATWSPNSTPSSSPAPQYSFLRSSFSARTSTTTNKHSNIKTAIQELEKKGIAEEGSRGNITISETAPATLKCSTCGTDFAFVSQIVSKGFTGRHGRAYLVSGSPAVRFSRGLKEEPKAADLINTVPGRAVSRQLVTGAHVVADISCAVCTTVVGWKYVDAKEEAQKYKIGKFILETKRVVRGTRWEDVLIGENEGEDESENDEEEVLFDSEDEDECEDLFTGLWDRETVRRRRARQVGDRR